MSKNSYQSALDEVVKTLEQIDSGWKDIDKTILSASKNIRKISAKGLDSGLPKDVDDRIQKSIKERENILNAIERQRLAELKLQKDREAAFDKFEIQLKKEQAAREAQITKESSLRETLEKQKQNQFNQEVRRANQQAKGDARQAENQKILSRNAREAAVLGSKLAGEYQKQEVILNQLRRRYKDVALTQGESSKAARTLRKEVIELDAKLKRVDGSVGQFQRNVGNYGSAFKSLGGVLRSTASAFGVMTGGFLAASIIKNGISRIREFDKEMQNMAGVTRTSRADLKDLESQIISVAGSSVMTSNQVAKLATSLLVLGKTKEEVKQLLKPANDLGIALNTTSEEAGEFLVQSLNSFGKSAESASEFADVIATVRTKTSLDFQKMRDSFQYLSPISRALGKDLAYTGAIIGILADNGLKAESAGRLLGTAQQKLAKSGRSLNEALDAINNAQKEGKSNLEVLALASNLFGAQAGKVGVILANNTDIIERNAQAIRDNGGALDDLVNQQLESLDAKIKILDSTWEEFLLSMENGTGPVSNFFKSAIVGATGFLKMLTDINRRMDEFIEKGKADGNIEMTKHLNDEMKRLGLSMKEVADIEFKNVAANLQIINDKLYELNQRKREGLNGGLIGDFFLDQNIKKWSEAQAKANEFMNVIREARGEAREMDTDMAAGFDEKNVEHLTKALKPLKTKLTEVVDEQERLLNIPFPDVSTQNTVNELEKERLKIQDLITKYEDLIGVKKPYFDFQNSYKPNGEGEDGELENLRTKAAVEKELKEAKDNLSNSTKDQAPDIQKRIAALNKELEAWSTKTKTAKKATDDLYELEKSRASRAVAIEKEITANKELETDARLEANQRFVDDSLALLELERQNAVKNAKGNKLAITKINEEAENERYKILYEGEQKVKEIYADSFKDKLKDFSKLQSEDERRLEDEMATLRKSMMDKGATVEEIELAIEKAHKDSLDRQLQNQIDFITNELDAVAMTADEQEKIAEELHNAKMKLLDEEWEAKKKAADREKDIAKIQEDLDKELLERKKELYDELTNLAYNAVEGIFQAEAEKYDRRIDANNDFYNALLDNEHLSEEQREDIERQRVEKDKELQKKKEEVEKRAFMSQQLMKVAEIGIDTIQKVAAIKATAFLLASNPATAALASAALAQIPFVIGTGTFAAGAVLAQTIPAFEKGKDKNDPYEGAMLWGEKVPEVKVDKKGNVEVAAKPTFGTTKKGDTIFPNIKSYLESLNMDVLNHAAIMTSLKSQSRNLNEKETGQVLTDQIEKAIYKGYGKVKQPSIPLPDYGKLASQIAREMTLNSRANV